MARHQPPSTVLLVGTAALHRDPRWRHVSAQGFTLVPVARAAFRLDQSLTPDVHAIVYQTEADMADTLAFLNEAAARQNDLCIILLGKHMKADSVALSLRRGAFDYISWPCTSARLTDAITSGLANRRTFLEVRNLSGELASANAALSHDRDMLKDYNQRLAGLNQLTQALAGSLNAEAVVQALFAGLPALIRADLIGVARSSPTQVWTWLSEPARDREAAVRAHLISRIERTHSRITAGATTLRMVHSRPLPIASTVTGAAGDGPTPDGLACDIPLVFGPHSHGVLHVARTGSTPFTEQEQQLLATIGTSLSLSLRNADTYQHIQELALRDPLTGVLNRRALDAPLAREFKAGLRYGTSACLMLLDLDYFKTVNDRLGHTAGDQVLKDLAKLMTDTVRDIDIVGRYGGEEFAVVLPHTSLEQAHALAERLRSLIERQAFRLEDGMVRTTVSIGLADAPHPAIASIADWIEAADSALYEAKAQGRNRVVVHSPVHLAPVQAAAICAAA
ncbi:MAG: diguanylate cyclase [Nitrospira sp.]|jgi:diguanylate cyclase (GGDEF)-like protein|nr:diguanylate cyclase [Nitrospira sp.]